MKDQDKFLKLVEWSEEDQCYIGSIPGWIGPCCHGKKEESVYSELCQIAEEWLEIYKTDGLILPAPTNKKFSGKFQLRLGNELHKALSLKAMQTGDSLNSFCVKLLKQSLTPHHHIKG